MPREEVAKCVSAVYQARKGQLMKAVSFREREKNLVQFEHGLGELICATITLNLHPLLISCIFQMQHRSVPKRSRHLAAAEQLRIREQLSGPGLQNGELTYHQQRPQGT